MENKYMGKLKQYTTEDICMLLEKSHLKNIFRAVDLVTLHFADKNNKMMHLHVSCPCRFEHPQEGIVVGSYDTLRNYDNEYILDAEIGDTVFDDIVSRKNNGLTGNNVRSCTIRKNGDIQIDFENNVSFTTFIDESFEDEEWRFFTDEAYDHFVCIDESTRIFFDKENIVRKEDDFYIKNSNYYIRAIIVDDDNYMFLESINDSGKTSIDPLYCPFRLENNEGSIILGSYDVYIDKSNKSFHKLLTKVNKKLFPAHVECLLYNSLGDSVFVLDNNCQLVYFNDSAIKEKQCIY